MKKCEPIFDYFSYQIPFFEDRIANNLYEIFINYFQNNFNTNLNIDFKDILVEIIFILPESAIEYKN